VFPEFSEPAWIYAQSHRGLKDKAGKIGIARIEVCRFRHRPRDKKFAVLEKINAHQQLRSKKILKSD